MAKVVNCRVQYIRPKYQNLKEWCDDCENNVYIGRKGVVFVQDSGLKRRYPTEDSIFYNPYKIGKDGCRQEVIDKYRKYILHKIDQGEITKEEIMRLRGKNLGCWCSPEPCHGDVLVELIHQIQTENNSGS